MEGLESAWLSLYAGKFKLSNFIALYVGDIRCSSSIWRQVEIVPDFVTRNYIWLDDILVYDEVYHLMSVS